MSETNSTPSAAEAVKLDVRAYPIEKGDNNVVGFANVTFNDMVAISGIRILDSEKGLFVSMPRAKDSQGEYRDIAFPVMKGLRSRINKAVLDAYTAEKEQAQEKPSVREQVKDGAEKAKSHPKPKKEAPDKSADAR